MGYREVKIIGLVWIILFLLATPSIGGEEEFITRREKELSFYFKGVKSPDNYGTFVLRRDRKYPEKLKDRYGLGNVVFPHWFHRIGFSCKVCHADIGFTMKVDADDIRMMDILQGKWCGKCHNGKVAFAPLPLKCPRCHSLGNDVPENHKIEETMKGLPETSLGNKIDWVKSLERGNISIRANIEGDEEMIVFGKDIEFIPSPAVPMPVPPVVVFPHKTHTRWLHCTNCHPSIFSMNSEENADMNMSKILDGEYCGVCHGKVAFSLNDCFRCHSRPPNTPEKLKGLLDAADKSKDMKESKEMEENKEMKK